MLRAAYRIFACGTPSYCIMRLFFAILYEISRNESMQKVSLQLHVVLKNAKSEASLYGSGITADSVVPSP